MRPEGEVKVGEMRSMEEKDGDMWPEDLKSIAEERRR